MGSDPLLDKNIYYFDSSSFGSDRVLDLRRPKSNGLERGRNDVSQQWEYQAFGQQFGPVSTSELQELAATGLLTQDSDIRRVGERTWRRASSVDGLQFKGAAQNVAPHPRPLSDPDLSTRGGAADEWYCLVGVQESGPHPFDELQRMAESQQLTAEDQVRLGKSGKWRRVGSIGRLMAALPFQATPTRTIVAAVNPAPPAAEASVGIDRALAAEAVSAPRRTPEPVSPRPSASLRSRPRTPVEPIPVQADSVVAPSRSTPRRAPAAVRETSVDESEQIAHRVEECLASLNLPGQPRIGYQLEHSEVTVRGSLASEGERLLVLHRLRAVAGVARVVDQLTVNQVARPTPVAAMPQRSPARTASRSSGPGLFTRLQQAVSGEYRNHAIAAAISLVVCGAWFYPRGPVRPVAVHPVKGTVVIDGQPIANAAIVLHHVGNSKLPQNLHPRGMATSDGTFSLETFDRADGAPEGEFIATVSLLEENIVDGEKSYGLNLLPAVYSRPETSPLKLKITSATKELEPLKLTRQ